MNVALIDVDLPRNGKFNFLVDAGACVHNCGFW